MGNQVARDRTAAQVNKELDTVGAAIASDLAPAHADAIKGLAEEEPAIFSSIMALIHRIHKSKHRK